MWIRHRNKLVSFFLAALAALLASLFQGHVPNTNPAPSPVTIEQSASLQDEAMLAPYRVTERRRIHILYGDGTGGGHKAGAGKPGKTEFPPSWDEDKIITTITKIANDNHLPMRQSGKRYWLRMGEEENLQIRVVLDRERREIVTGYPVNVSKNSR